MAKIVDLAGVAMKKAMPHLKTFWYYGKVELAPPKISEIPAVISGLGNLVKAAKNGAWKNVTVKEAVINAMITTEVACWFFIGEIIGKRHIIGYKLN